MSDDRRWGDDSAQTLQIRPPDSLPRFPEDEETPPQPGSLAASVAGPAAQSHVGPLPPALPPGSGAVRVPQPSSVWKKVREPEVEPLPLTTRRVDPESVLQELRAPPRPSQLAPEELANTMDVHPWDVVDVHSARALPHGALAPLPALPVRGGGRRARRGWVWLLFGIAVGIMGAAAGWLWLWFRAH